jgi:hypothetical protein
MRCLAIRQTGGHTMKIPQKSTILKSQGPSFFDIKEFTHHRILFCSVFKVQSTQPIEKRYTPQIISYV